VSKIQVWVLKGALCGLELHEVKVSRAVLRGACGLVTILWGGNAPRLPDLLTEVAILASDREQSARKIIILIFSRRFQENDFYYLINHFGIDELTSRAYESYSSYRRRINRSAGS